MQKIILITINHKKQKATPFLTEKNCFTNYIIIFLSCPKPNTCEIANMFFLKQYDCKSWKKEIHVLRSKIPFVAVILLCGIFYRKQKCTRRVLILIHHVVWMNKLFAFHKQWTQLFNSFQIKKTTALIVLSTVFVKGKINCHSTLHFITNDEYMKFCIIR